MARSLLPDPNALFSLTQRLQGAPELREWPEGSPQSRLLAEYLVGRSTGRLDVSGRPSRSAETETGGAQTGGAGTAAPGASDPGMAVPGTTGPASNDCGKDGARPRSGTGGQQWSDMPLLVVGDDENGALVAVAAAVAAERAESAEPAAEVTAVPVFAYNDEIGADASAQAAGARLLSALQDVPAGPLRCIIVAPKAMDALRELLQAIAGKASEVVVVGRDKHLSTAVNSELARWFNRVDVSPGLAKSRIIVGSEPHDSADAGSAFPQRAVREADIPGVPPLEVVAHGACFGSTSVDPGSQLLLQTIAERPRVASPLSVDSLLDLGCGNGWLLTAAALLLQPKRAVGADVSKAACASAAATAEVAGVDAQILLSDAGEELADSTFDLVLLNPPFHAGTTVTTEEAHRMIDAALRLLRPGGHLVCVFNSHLRYRSHINAAFGGSRQWARNPKFTVVAAQK